VSELTAQVVLTLGFSFLAAWWIVHIHGMRP